MKNKLHSFLILMATICLTISILQPEANGGTAPDQIKWVSRTFDGNYAVLDVNMDLRLYNDAFT